MRLRWACEESGLPYAVRTVPFEGREAEHFARQPFGQVPFVNDGEVELFESGAGLLYIAHKSEKLMPRDAIGEAQTLQWIIAALNSIEMVTVPWWFLEITGAKENTLTSWMESRLGHIESALSERDWLAADRFTAADISVSYIVTGAKFAGIEADIPASVRAYVDNLWQRPAFQRAAAVK